MKLTTRSEYALLALVFLARRQNNELVSVEVIAREQKIPEKFLEQILLALKRSGYLRSSRGQHGGYAMLRLPHEITLAEIVRLFDGPLAPTASASRFYYQTTPIEKEKRLLKVFKDVRNYIATTMENTTLADVL